MTGLPNKAFSIVENHNSLNWDEVLPDLLPVLVAYAHSLIGNSTLSLSKNKVELAKDFAMETIRVHIENPKKFDPNKNKDLVKYLKLYILRRLISNYKNLGSQKNELIFEEGGSTYYEVQNTFINENKLYEKIDYDNVIKNIEQALTEEPLLLEVFVSRIKIDSTPVEICDDLNISKSEYNNRFRRLKTIMKAVVKQTNETHE